MTEMAGCPAIAQPQMTTEERFRKLVRTPIQRWAQLLHTCLLGKSFQPENPLKSIDMEPKGVETVESPSLERKCREPLEAATETALRPTL